MKHTFFALFPSGEQAHAALKEAQHTPVSGEFDLRVHTKRLRQEDLTMVETEGRVGVNRGALVGAVVGALTAILVFALMGYGAALPPAAAVGAVFGGLMGALLRGLVGSTEPDPTLREWQPLLAAGSVAVTVTVDGRDEESRLEELFEHHGARTAHKHLI